MAEARIKSKTGKAETVWMGHTRDSAGKFGTSDKATVRYGGGKAVKQSR